MRLALARVNPTVGDLDTSAGIIARAADAARQKGADLVVFPELALTGYPPKDLLLQVGFIAAVVRRAREVGESCSAGITLVFGAPLPLDDHGRRLTNSLLAYQDGKLLARYDKRLLPTYDVFDEDRYFVAGSRPVIIDVKGVRVGLSICEDLWRGQDVGFADRYLQCPDPVDELCRPPDAAQRGAQIIINPSASPFVLGKTRRHRELLRRLAAERSVYVAAVNQVGGNDELIFDGASAVFDSRGQLLAEGGGDFSDGLTMAEIPGSAVPVAAETNPPAVAPAPDEALLFRALTLGIKDYCRKTGFKSAVLGLSGGIDSAVVAVLAAAALGPANVHGLLMPSRYSSQGSIDDARALATALGIPHHVVPIEAPFAALESTLSPVFAGRPPDVTEENIQSRIRGTLLMAASNKFGHILLTTGNKSELAVGYCTLYGDMNGGLAVISDVTKILVYRLARWLNEHCTELGIAGLRVPPIPEATITKAPSAELRPNQTDQDSLPAYHVLDEIIERYVERREPTGIIIKESGIDESVVRKTIRMIDLAEYKRKQAPIGLKVTGVAFGSGRRMPIAQGWRPERA